MDTVKIIFDLSLTDTEQVKFYFDSVLSMWAYGIAMGLIVSLIKRVRA